MKRIDAHSHVNLPAYGATAPEVINRALEQGTGMIAVGTNMETSRAAIAVAAQYENIWATIGLHPNNLFPHPVIADEGESGAAETLDIDEFRMLAKSSAKIVGIGECGLDYFRLPESLPPVEAKSIQQAALRQQFDLALELGLPVMLHCRDAHDDLASIIEEYAAAGRTLRGNVHCFTGTLAEAQRYLAAGFFLSFTGVITYPPRAAEKARGETLQDVVRQIPLDRMLIETDAPWLAPAPHRGEQNEPAWVSAVAAKIAELKGIPVEEVERATLENTVKLFGLK